MSPRLSLLATALASGLTLSLSAAEPAPPLRAGAAKVDITPPAFPVLVNGGFLEKEATKAFDPLHARALVLDDGATRVALCVVDTCMMTRELIDAAKAIAQRQTGISTERMLVSATHTHSAPSAMACLGSRIDPKYAAFLPGKVAEAIATAVQRLEPARVGWAVTPAWDFTNCRRWIRRPDRMLTDPFGVVSARANMHPGYVNPDALGPSGPIDPDLSLLSVQNAAGQPLAVLANFSMHYFGAGALSADYCGRFSEGLGRLLGADDAKFIGILSQGTSGDSQWMDYSRPKTDTTLDQYTNGLLQLAAAAVRTTEHRPTASLAMAETTLKLRRRVADPERLAWARQIVDALGDRPPASQKEVYAREQLLIAAEPERELKLQALRIGELGITAIPNEVYAITGLKLKAQSPLRPTFNIELANGSDGYIPPPEQHRLGGYTTWAARTAGLEPEAEPRIVETVLGLLEKVAGGLRRTPEVTHGPYVQAILEAKPLAYWRLEEMVPPTAADASGHGHTARFDWEKGVAFHLLGAGSGLGASSRASFTNAAFSGPGMVNRAVHFAGGSMLAELPTLGAQSTVSVWLWNGLDPKARAITGTVLQRGNERLAIAGTSGEAGRLFFAQGATTLAGQTPLLVKDWHHVALVRDGLAVTVYLDGELELAGKVAAPAQGATLAFGGVAAEGNTLEGKIDEAAVFERALTAEEVAAPYRASGPPPRAIVAPPEVAKPKLVARVAMPAPKFTDAYTQALTALKPVARRALAEGDAFTGPRLTLPEKAAAPAWSLSLWFRNDLATNARAVTAYLLSRGPDGDHDAPGDHLGIGGNYRPGYDGRLLFYNGNARAQTLLGQTVIAPGSWNHLVFVRDGRKVAAYLNGQLELSGEADLTAEAVRTLFLGARCDQFAPLQGVLVEAALFDRALAAAEVARLSATVTLAAAAAPPDYSAPPIAPLSPQDSLRKLHVAPGLKAELVVAEPMVLDPVAFDWDLRGRLWVVEMADYPLGLDNEGRGGGRVRILEDTDGDGRYDKSTLFADGLNFPNGILTWRDGAIVTAAPNILFIRDTTGDDRADEQEVLVSGLQEGNQQLRANGLRWGLDNWVYVAAGGHHGKYGVDTRLRSRRRGAEVQVGSRDFRFRPDTGELEPQSGPTQFGRNRDNFGHWFGSQNSNPLWHYLLPDQYLRRNPFVGVAETRVQLLTPANPPVFPASPQEKRFHSFNQAGHFTSACSGMIVRDAGAVFSSGVNALVCEPFHNLVQHAQLTESGVTFTAERIAGAGSFDFLASEDRWCRPVMVREGPDGALWVADMYRYMIEHPQFLPPVGKDELLPHYRAGDDRGRIYRVAREGAASFRPVRLDQMDAAQLVATLGSPHGWLRDKAQQALLWRGERAATAPLLELAKSGDPLARLHALCTLDGLGALPAEVVARALGDAVPGVRENALRLAETRFTPEVLAAARRLVDDPETKVRLQLAFSLGATSDPAAGEALARLLEKSAGEPMMLAAVLSSARPHLATLAEAAGAQSEALLTTALGAQDRAALALLLELILAKQDPAAFTRLLDLLAQQGQTLDGLRGTANDSLAKVLAATDALMARSTATMNDAARSATDRIAAAALLGRLDATRDPALQALTTFLGPQESGDTQAAAIRALGAIASTAVPAALGKAWPTLSPTPRQAALAVWMSREAWALDLIERVQRGEIIAASLDAVQRGRLLKHESARVQQVAGKVFEKTGASSRAKVVESYRAALQLTADPAKGREVYLRHCAVCHRRSADGKDIGPDLASVVEHPPEKLLASILDPNADIQPGFNGYTCTLTSGEQLYGLVAAETANSVTMKLPDATQRTILRSQIKTLQSQNQSLMPEGLEAALPPQDVADLIGFLRQPVR